MGDPFVGSMQCPKCSTTSLAWQSSGMSACEPHFYCNECSNAVVMDSCKKYTWDQEVEINEELLNKICKLLPSCPCGGKFTAGCNPKCPKCKTDFSHQSSPIKRLTDPHVILINGACMCDENGKIDYKIKIKG